MSIVEGNHIDPKAWADLVSRSPVATWFQTHEAYSFFDGLSFLKAFAYAVEVEGQLKGVMVGYIQKDGGKLKQFFSRRAIVLGGPLLAHDISDEELTLLLHSVKELVKKKAIYLETRNFNDYSRWRTVFEDCGCQYEPHLNFHINTESVDIAQANVGKHRWRYIRISLRDGASLIETPSSTQLKAFYSILRDLYRTKVKTPLFPNEFFDQLSKQNGAKFFLVECQSVVIGGAVCVCLEGKAVYEWFVCGDEGFQKGIRPSSVATWFGIDYSARNGYPVFDLMGAGKPNEEYGVRDFKAEFGGKLVEHGRYVFVSKPLLYRVGKLGVKIMKKL